MTVYHTDFESYERLAKAGEEYRSEHGVIYTVFSNKKEIVKSRFVTNSIRSKGNVVHAYTYNCSMDEATGTWDGRKCHWVVMKNDEFVANYKLVN